MKGSLSAAEVHKQYSEGVTAFRRQIADATLRVKFTQEADVFLRACALGVWQRDGASLTPRHVEYYNAIYTKGNPAPSILFWELSTAVSEYPGFRVPDFFARMRACDKVSGTHLARRFIDLVTLMLLLFAAVDDVVSEEEAGFVNTCADTLSALCDRDGLKGEKAPLDVKDFVTRRPAPPKADAPAAAAAPAGAGQAAAAAGEEAEPAPSLEELMAELDGLCGLDKVKADAFLDGTLSREELAALTARSEAERSRLARRLADLEMAGAERPERRAALLDWLAGELAGGEAVLDAAVKRVTVQADALLVELEELPLCFRVRAQAGGRGAARRVEVTECTPLPR